jgi:hypothetical protein
MAPALKELLLMSVKDIGHFEPMFSCSSVASLGSSDFANGEVVERTRRGVQSGFGDMQIAGRGLEISMTKQ